MSLHWILMLTVTLLHCLTAFPTQNKGDDIDVSYEEIKQVIDELERKGCNANDSVFYSPSGSNKCTISALKCSIQELETYKNECFVNNTEDNLVNRIKESIDFYVTLDTVQTEQSPKDCSCEGTEEKPYKEFLKNILTLLEKLNSN